MDVLWLRISCLGWFCNQEELGKKEEEERGVVLRLLCSRSQLGDFSYAVATCWPEMSLYRDKRLFGSPWFGHRGRCCLRGWRAIPELALLRGLRHLLQRVLAFPIAHVINAAGCCLLSGLGTCLGWLGL